MQPAAKLKNNQLGIPNSKKKITHRVPKYSQWDVSQMGKSQLVLQRTLL